jgi:hypothetical protein
MTTRGRNLMVLDVDYVMHAAELLTFTFASRRLSGLNYEVML